MAKTSTAKNGGHTIWSPDFIGIGAMKSATSWLYYCLKAHPEICMSSKKEIHFFSRSNNFQKGIEWYESFFSHCDPELKRGEFTPDYLPSLDAAALIHENFPDAKLIACLRNPVDRAYSHYRYSVARKGRMSMYDGIEQAIKQEDDLVEKGMYCKQLKAFYNLFPSENILVLLYDDVKDSPLPLLHSLYSFIGVDSTFVPDFAQTKMGATEQILMEYKVPFITPLAYRTRKLIKGSKLDSFLSELGIKKKMQSMILKNRRKISVNEGQELKLPPLSSEIRKRLEPIFIQDIKRLEVLLGRNLSAWTQD
jgi:hypothetical protein